MQPAKRPLDVAFLVDRWQPARGGAERALAELAGSLAARGHRVRAFACEGPRAGETAPAVEWVRVAAPRAYTRGARERRLGRALVDAARAAGCDVTIGVRHLPETDLYWPHAGSHAAAHAALRASRGRAAAPPHGRHRAFVELERELLERGGARVVACVSELVRGELAQAYPTAAPRMVVVENGVDLERFHPGARDAGLALRAALALAPGEPLVVFAARNPELKGLPALASALALLPARRWRLLVAGPRETRRWERALARAGLARDRFRVVADADPLALATAADLVALPTWRDTSGLALLEALAAGTPVVTTSRAGASARVGPDAGSVVADPGDATAIARELERWLERVERGAIDRDAVRASVADLGRARWLARMEELVIRASDRSVA